MAVFPFFLKYWARGRERRGVASETGTNPREGAPYLPTRVTLLSRLRDWDDRESWQEFFDTYWKLIYTTATKAGLADAEAQDVVQEVLVGASRSMPKFKYDPSVGSFKGWLVCITKRKIANQFRKRPPWDCRKTEQGADPIAPEELPAPDEDLIDRLFEHEWKRSLVEAAMKRVKAKVKLRHFQIFDLYVIQQLTVAEVCSLLKVSAPQVYLARHRVAKRLKEEVARLQKETGDRLPS